MGLRDAFNLTAHVAGRNVTPSARRQLASPWRTSSSLSRIVLADVLGMDTKTATRADAMRIPAIVKGRALIAGTLSRYPLVLQRSDERLEAAPWMQRTSTLQSPQMRMLWTLDDLIFHGSSLWAVERGARGRILDAVRVATEEWDLNEDLQIEVRGSVVDEDQVILFEGPQEGLLEIGAPDVHSSHAMRRAWAMRVESPVPLIELHMTDDTLVMTNEEIDDLVRDWEESRKRGGTAFTPAGVEVKERGTTPTDLFVQGRNAARLDWANFLNLPAALMEGSMATSTLTYSTTEGKRAEFVDYSLAYWAMPIEARLSMDDVVPAGTHSKFDLSWMTATNPTGDGPVRED